MTTLHLSGEWNRPDAVVRRATLALVKAHKPLVVSHTEATKHLDALLGLPGYRLYGSGECALHLRNDIRVIAEREVTLSPLPIPRRNGALCRSSSSRSQRPRSVPRTPGSSSTYPPAWRA